jgi:hypothetical protein
MLPMTGLPSSTGLIHARSPGVRQTDAGRVNPSPPGCCGCNPKSKPRLWEDAAHAPVEVHKDR